MPSGHHAPKYVPAEQVEDYRAQAELAKDQARRATQAADTRLQEGLTAFRATYPLALKFVYRFKPDVKPFFVHAMFHDDHVTYIQAQARELPVLYEIKDGAPNLITFDVRAAPMSCRRFSRAGISRSGRRGSCSRATRRGRRTHGRETVCTTAANRASADRSSGAAAGRSAGPSPGVGPDRHRGGDDRHSRDGGRVLEAAHGHGIAGGRGGRSESAAHRSLSGAHSGTGEAPGAGAGGARARQARGRTWTNGPATSGVDRQPSRCEWGAADSGADAGDDDRNY
jgi:hypothetical protein